MDEHNTGGDPPSAESIEEAETALHGSAGIHGSDAPVLQGDPTFRAKPVGERGG